MNSTQASTGPSNPNSNQNQARESIENDDTPSYSYEKDAEADEEQLYATESYQNNNYNNQSQSNQNQNQNQNQVLFDSSAPQQPYSDSNQYHHQQQQQQQQFNPQRTTSVPMPSNNLYQNQNQTQTQGFGGRSLGGQIGNGNIARPDHASYATSAGWGISNLAAAAWFLPPFSSVYVLVVETENDLARFHAYQSGLTGVTFFFIMWFLRSWLGWYNLSVIVAMAYFGWSWVCAQTAHRAAPTLTRMPYLPYFAEIAEQWVGEE